MRTREREARPCGGRPPLPYKGRKGTAEGPRVERVGDVEGTAETDVAIVGLGLRLPGADSPEAFWAMLREGRSAIRRVPPEELLANGEAPHLLDRPDYVPFAADLPGLKMFDPEFWGLSPKDAAVMDPQHRLFLEAAWEALERSGHDHSRFPGRIGVFAGSGQAAYYHQNVLTHPELVASTGLFLLRHTGNDKDFLATRLSHALDLRGPAVNVQTACSTSLVATHLAVQALLGGECDMALAGGVTVELPHGRGYLYREGEILSPDGACHAFDHRAEGTVFGSGAAVVALRRLADALRDGDPVVAVLKGTAVNNDGSRKAGYLAPSVDGQAACVREAHAVAGVGPASIGMVECHGTGTYLGDPIEVAALAEAFGDAPEGGTLIGSVKTNIGHTDTAAGTASLAKAALAVSHGLIPPSLGYEAPNPAIAFEGSPFRVADRLAPFPPGTPRAGVNSLGVGGTNAHAVVEAPPPRQPSEEAAFPFHLLAVSARSRPALEEASRNLAAHLLAERPPLADVAFTLLEGRRAFARRRVVVARTHEEAAALLTGGDARRAPTHDALADPSVTFMLPGGGAQDAGMGRDLYDTEPAFRDGMDRGLAVLSRLTRDDPREVWLPAPGREAWATERLLLPSVQLPLLLIVEHALAELWMDWGVRPSALIGHSMGENTAAALAGVLGFEDAVRLVHLRGTLFDSVAEGGMLSVALPEAGLRPHLDALGLDLACLNAPALSVASGPRDRLGRLAERLAAEGVEARPIPIGVAAHSRMLDGLLDPFGVFLRTLDLQPPRIPVVSNRTGTWLTDAEATDPAYWVGHLRGTVRFADGLATLAADPRRLYLEVGPGRALASLATQGGIPANQVVGSLRHRDDAAPDDEHFQLALGRVWAAGGAFDTALLWGGARRHRLALPTYPFQRAPYWLEPGEGARPAAAPPAREADIGKWGWAPRWTARYAEGPEEAERLSWLILEDEAGLGAAVAARLRGAGHAVATARPGDRFARLGEAAWAIPPEGGREGYERLLAEAGLPDRVLHLWLTATEGHRPGSSFFHRTQEQGFWSLLFLAQAWGAATDAPLHLLAASTGALQVSHEPLPHPEKATALGPLGVLPREMPGSTAALLDLDPAEAPGTRLEALLEEALAPPASRLSARRGGRRLERSWAPVPFPEAASLPIRRGGPVLVTGGLGGIGLTLALSLAREGAPVALLARRPLPPRAEWDRVLRREGGAAARRIRAVRAIEEAGGRVLPLAADVANPEEMRAAVAEAEAAFGPLSGVVHAAGVIDDAPLLSKDPMRAEEVLAPKVLGTQVLHDLFPDGRLDWLLLCSSSSTVTAPAGQADYVAANAYLSAYARSRAGGRTRVVAVDWGPWADVGMAAEAVAAREGRMAPPEPVALPLLDAAGFDGDGARVLSATWRARDRWALDEHRTAEGVALLPGTGVLELAAEAMAHQGEAFPWAIRDLAFLRPLRVPDEGAVAVTLTLPRSHAGYDLRLSADGVATAEARVELLPLPAPAPLDLPAIRARLDRRPALLTPRADGSLASPQERHLRFGRRWHVLREAALGEGEGLARLSVPATEGMALHPGLLDLATGWAMALIPGYEDSHLWVPLSYGCVEVHGPLPPEVLSHVRRASFGGGTATFDVDVADPSGRVLLRARGFAIRRLDSAPSFAAAPPAAGPRAASPAEERLAHAVRQGIRPEEGVEAFRRALAFPLPEVAVSPLDLRALLREADAPAAAAAPAFDRPPEAGDFVAPEGPVEERLAALWRDLLGVARVGAEDSFFDLGGHSLVAVRLFAAVKRAFGADFPISVLFEAPTLRALARLIAEAGGPAGAPDAPAAPAVRSRPVRRFTHLVPMHAGEGGPRAPFFLVAGMFGNVLNLRHLAGLLGSDRPFFGLQAQGLTGEAPPHDRIEEAAQSMLREMEQVHRGGPWLLGGFSGGGLTAFEIAQALRARGEEMGALVLLDTPLPRRRPLSRRDKLMIHWLEAQAQGPAYPLRWAARKLRKAPEAGEEAAEGAFHDRAIEAAFHRAIAAYEVRPWDGPLSLFRPPLRGRWQVAPDRLISSERAYVLPDNDWGPFAPRLEVVEVPGDHDSMVLEPNVRVLAARLRRVLDRAEREAAPDWREAAE